VQPLSLNPLRDVERVAEQIVVTGVVQGVGFRPFVHRLAASLGIDGRVSNDSTRVLIDVEGPSGKLDTFVERMHREAPPLARIESVVRSAAMLQQFDGFSIAESKIVAGARTLVPPDAALCADCRRELFDPSDRRYLHPFITCTNCGPRFTIITSLPYDRPNTTMADFEMCDVCASEYTDPADRRYHAQPISCLDCGPALQARSAGQTLDGDPIDRAVAVLNTGGVIAVKGIGGYHLACDAQNDGAVQDLRVRKRRPDKPFAIMVVDAGAAHELGVISSAEENELTSTAAPVVLVEAKPNSRLAPAVAPGSPLVGVMLAYTPVHCLLLSRFGGPLVMTSANRSGEPLAHDYQSIDELGDLYDVILDHDRGIDVACDDSVVRLVGDTLLPIRRARGYAPIPVRFSSAKRSVVATGAELKNAPCVAGNDHAWVSPHIGDMENYRTLESFKAMIRRLAVLFDVHRDVVAVDPHPRYLSSRWALEERGNSIVSVQHHHAHIGSVMAEHQLDPRTQVLGFAFDGAGYGDDGSIWGGEVLLANVDGFDRVFHLSAVPMPGGDAAIEHPGRMALAYLHAFGHTWSRSLAPAAAMSDRELAMLGKQLDSGFGCMPTTSMGRLFDAVAALVGLRQAVSYEAQAAIELEFSANADSSTGGGYRFALDDTEINARPVIESVLTDLEAAESVERIAWRFHDGVAEIVHRVASTIRAERGPLPVVLSGGVFQNALLVSMCIDRLEVDDFQVLTNTAVPPNDGGLALGQAYIAAHCVES